MASQDMLHAAEIMKAALPFVDPKTKVMAEFFTKILDLMGSLRSVTNMNLGACGFEGNKADLEGLLNSIKPLCIGKERDIIDRILNIFNMKRMFEMYNNMMTAMKAMQGFEGFSFNDSENGFDTDNVTGNFSGTNYDSIFGNQGNQSDDEATETRETFEEHHQQSGNTGMNRGMFDMLKAMVPPEQMSTFENLSMLFNTMSYDNNSKTDVSEENNNG